MEKRHFKIVLILFLLLVILAGALVVSRGQEQKPDSASAAPVLKPSPIEISKPTPAPSVAVMGSPDGKSELRLIKVESKDNNSWTLSVDGKTLLKTKLPQSTKVEVPQNSFSPDNKYVFLKMTTESTISYPVFSVKDEVSNEGDPALEFASLFYEKFPEYKITEATGWGGLNLIVFNTVEVESNKRGPSFWFEVPSRSFIRLSTRFD